MSVEALKGKTIPEIVKEHCSKAWNLCRDCVAECEFEGTEKFGGKWILEVVVLPLLKQKEELALGFKEIAQVLLEKNEGFEKQIADLKEKLERDRILAIKRNEVIVELEGRLELLEGIRTELLDMKDQIEDIENFEDAKRCTVNLAKLWESFGEVLDIEE